MKQKRIEKPWGYEIIWAQTKNYVGKLLHIDAGHRLSKQYHEEKEETVYVINGTLYNTDESGIVLKIECGDSFHVSPGQIHRFQALSGSVDFMEVSTDHLDDVVRLSDDYERD